MKPEYARNLMRMQFFKYAYYYNMSKIYEDLYLKSSKNVKYFKKQKTFKTGYIVRYADDFKIFTPNYREAIKWFNGIKQFIEKKLHLEISEEKSKIVNLKKSKSNFLGFELKIVDTKRKHKERRTNVKNKSSKTKYILQVRVSKEKICEMSREFKESLKLLIKDANNSSKIIGRLNTKILGWQNYCKLSTYPSKDLNEVYMRNYTKMNVLKRYYGILKCMNMHINQFRVIIRKLYKDILN